MNINDVIRKRRKELDLTQEQLAEKLFVSSAAVSKWENSLSNPDIDMLPRLARLLKIDLNTLFDFDKDITDSEIGFLCNEITRIFNEIGFKPAFDAAEDKINEYPYNEKLMQCLAVLMEGMLSQSQMGNDEYLMYKKAIFSYYEALAESNDIRIANSAQYMLAKRYIDEADYDKAKAIVSAMENGDLLMPLADKNMLNADILAKTNQTEDAIKILQGELWMTVNKAQVIMSKMADIYIDAGNIDAAHIIAEKIDGFVSVFDLWSYISTVYPLHTSLAKNDESASIDALRNMLSSLNSFWSPENTVLFNMIASQAGKEENTDLNNRMISLIVSEIKNDSRFDFMSDNAEFKSIINEYDNLTQN